jgi:hypothetical protein
MLAHRSTCGEPLPALHTKKMTGPRGSPPFPIFARARSTKYFNKIKDMIGVETPQEFQTLIKSPEISDHFLRSGLRSLSIRILTAIDDIASKE